MSEMDPDSLKYVEIRDELKARGLETRGTRGVLLQRLKKALEKEKGRNHWINILSNSVFNENISVNSLAFNRYVLQNWANTEMVISENPISVWQKIMTARPMKFVLNIIEYAYFAKSRNYVIYMYLYSYSVSPINCLGALALYLPHTTVPVHWYNFYWAHTTVPVHGHSICPSAWALY